MGNGNPGIYTSSGIVKEFGINNENCILVDFKNEAAIYESMLGILDDSALRDKLVKNGREVALSKFTISEMCVHLNELYSR